jgi:F-box and WD-40 domain protein 1/11
MSPDSSTHWNLDEHQQLQLPHPDHPEDGHAGIVYGVHLQGDYLVSVSIDKTARIWDLKTQRSLHQPLVGHTGSVIAVQSDVADDVIITGGKDGIIMVWRFSTGESVKAILEAHDSVLCLHFDQRYLVTGGKDGKIKLWNRHSLDVNHTDVPKFAIRPAEGDRYQEYSLLATLEGPDAAVLALKLRDNVLVSGSGDSTMCIWSLQTGEILQKINIHQSGVASLRYNGRFIVSGSTDRSAKIYDVDQKAEVACLSGHTNLIHSVQAVFGDDDGAEVKTVITGSYDGTVRVWEQVPGSRKWQTQHQTDVGTFEANQKEHQDNEAKDIGMRNSRVFSVDLDANRLVCAGQGPVIRVWNLCSPSK